MLVLLERRSQASARSNIDIYLEDPDENMNTNALVVDASTRNTGADTFLQNLITTLRHRFVS